jgi:DNA-binding winged helix-turn-helix (wHTH) protein
MTRPRPQPGDRKLLYSFADLVLDTEQRELRRGVQPIALQPQVFDLLAYLVANRHRVVSKDDLIAAVWGGRIVSESALTTRINAVRAAVGDSGEAQQLVRTLPRKGFRFVGEVREGPAEEALASTKPVLQPALPAGAAAAERRQLTVASCELLLGVRGRSMDPEDLREIVRGYHGRVVDTARRHGGFVAYTHGNTASVFFGYPQAHEDDAERAVDAALSLIAAIAALKSPIPLQARFGIATGLVVVGDTGAAGELDIAGETPSLATRLQGVAVPNTVVVAESTRRLLGALFELQDLGEQNLEGSEVVRVFKAVRPSAVQSRFEALHADGLTALIGREEELELLLRRWSRAKAGQGQAVLLSGEPGIGKSRLTVALSDAIATEPHTRLRYFCSPQHADSALYPIIGQMERASGLAHDDAPSSRLDKLDALLEPTATSARDAALLAEMLSLPNDGRYPTLVLDPPQRRQKTLEALVSQLEALSHSEPVLMIFEDVHWIDPSSLEALDRTVERIKALRVLLIVTHRPEFEAPWIGQPHVMALIVNRLSEREVSALIRRVADRALPPNLLHDIVERSDGIPLFVEEITKAALEASGEEAVEAVVALVPSPALAVPATLHASLMARLDRLGASAKEVAQIGAAIGREFSHALLAAVARKSPGELERELDRLVSAGLLFRHGVAPHATYLFKHALVQDAAYGTLLRVPRRQLHTDIATTIRNGFPELARDQPELIAMHLVNAESYREALPHILAAARNFTRRYSYIEALRWFERGAQILPNVPADEESLRIELDLYVEWTPVLMAVSGYVDQQTSVVAKRADALCRQFGVVDRLLPVLFAQLSFYGAGGGSLSEGLDFGLRILQIGEETGDHVALMTAHRFAGFCYLWLGRYDEASAELLDALDCFHRIPAAGLAETFGQDPETTSHVLLGSVRQCMGLIEEGEALMQQALAKAHQLGHPLTLGYVLRHYAIFATLQKKYSAVITLSEELTRVCFKYQIRQWFDLGPLMATWSRFHLGQEKNAAPAILALLAQHRTTSFRRNLPFYMMLVADVLFDSGRADQARELADEAFSLMQKMNEAWLAPYLRALRERIRK